MMYKNIIIIMFCSVRLYLHGMENNIKIPPGSPVLHCIKNAIPYKNTGQLQFINDSSKDLVLTTYVVKKLRRFILISGATFYLQINSHPNYFIDIAETTDLTNNSKTICLKSNFVDETRNLKETICVNQDSVLLYYEFLENPITLVAAISLKEILEFASQKRQREKL